MNESSRHQFLLFSVLLIMIGCLPLRAQWLSAPTPKREYRAVWLTTIKNLDWPSTPASTPTGEALQRAELCAILDTLHAVGINTVLLQTRLRGDVIYPSMREPVSAFITGKEGQRTTTYDPLQFTIDECHKRGMQCHAWIVALQIKDNKYVDPAEPAVVSHLCDMVREVVRGYEVDGIHLDYLRYPEKTKGRDQWRRDNVTACLRAVYRTVKAEKPWLCVSVAPLGKYRNTARASSQGWNAYYTVFQEAQEWLREGICDALFPMMYYDGPHFYPFVEDWAAHTYGHHFAAGLGIYQLDPTQLDWDISTIRSQISHVRSFAHEGACGYALFRAGFIMNDTKGIRRELRHLNTSPALVPALADESHGRPDSPSAVTFTLIGDSIQISWAAAGGQTTPPIRYNLYRSVGTPVDTTDSNHLYLTYLNGTTVTIPRTTRTASASYALTAIDSYGRESRPVVWNLKKSVSFLSPLSARR